MIMAASETRHVATPKERYVPPVSDEELARSNRELRELLTLWATEGDEQDHRETLEVLRDALGARRVASNRNLFP
jgi:hypothetical protein